VLADVAGADVAGAGEDVLLDAVEAGLLTGLLTEPAPGRIRFAHDLVRDTLYQGLSQLRRAGCTAGPPRPSNGTGQVRWPRWPTTSRWPAPTQAPPPGTAAWPPSRPSSGFAYRAAVQLWEQAIGCLDQARRRAAP
jgi:hypothetical protein